MVQQGSTTAVVQQDVAPGGTATTGPTGPGTSNVSAVPVEQGGQQNLSLICSADVEITCEKTVELSLSSFLGDSTPRAEDAGAGVQSTDKGTGERGAEAAGSADITTPTRIETGAGGAAPLS